MAIGVPITPRISLNDLAEFVQDMSPATGGVSWEDSAQSVVYDIPFQYLYDSLLLLLGYAYTQEQECQKNGDPTNTTPPATISVPEEFTANTSNGSNYLDNLSSMSGIAVGSKIYRKSTQALIGTVVSINGNNNTDSSFRAIQLDTEQSGLNTGISFQIGRNSAIPNVEKRKFLKRLLPAAHPVFPYMICTRIDSWQGVGPRGKASSLTTMPLSTILKNVPRYTSIYNTLRLTATYTMPKYKLAVDSKYGNEIVRYFWREQSPSANFITLDKGTMVFAEGGLGGVPPTVPGYSQPEVMQNFSYYWSHIPEDYINTETTYTANAEVITDIGLPIRFVQALQCVNQLNFLGFKPGTLLMEPYEYERFRMPLEFTDSIPRFWVRLKINMKYFNPKYIANGNDPRVKFGHLTAPHGMNGYAYFQVKSALPGQPAVDRFASYDFNSLFFPLLADQRTQTV